jgi:hypothetical protein
MNRPDAREHLAHRVASDDWFLSSVLTAYQDRHRLDDAALAARLGCDVARLVDLRLCRRPGAALPQRTVEQDIHDIAARYGVNAAVLASIVREGLGRE